jgi:hypothetical protein
MAFTNATKEAAALAVTALGSYVSLHTADPSTTGASETTGGGYVRKQTTWTGGASDGSVPGSQVAFDAAAGTYTHIGIWSAASAGTYVAGFALSAPVTLGASGQVLVTPTVTAS